MRKIFLFFFFLILPFFFSQKTFAAPPGFENFPDTSNLNCSVEGDVITTYFTDKDKKEDHYVSGLAVYAVESPYISPIPGKKNANYGEPVITDAKGKYNLVGLDCNNATFVQFVSSDGVLKTILIDWGRREDQAEELKEDFKKAKYNLRLGEPITTGSANYNIRMQPNTSEISCDLREDTERKFKVDWPLGLPTFTQQVSLGATCLLNLTNCLGAIVRTTGDAVTFIFADTPHSLYTTYLTTDRRWRRTTDVLVSGLAPNVNENELPDCSELKQLNEQTEEKPWLLGKGGAYFRKGARPGSVESEGTIENRAKLAQQEVGDKEVCKQGSTPVKFCQFALPNSPLNSVNDGCADVLDNSYFPYYMIHDVKDPQTRVDNMPIIRGLDSANICAGVGCTPQGGGASEEDLTQPGVLGGGPTKSPKTARKASDDFGMFQRPGHPKPEDDDKYVAPDSGISELITPGKECTCPEGDRVADSQAPGGFRCSQGGATFNLSITLTRSFIQNLCQNNNSGACQDFGNELETEAGIETRVPDVEDIGYNSYSVGNGLARPGAPLNNVGSVGSTRDSKTKDDTFFTSKSGGNSETSAGYYTDAFRRPGSIKN